MKIFILTKQKLLLLGLLILFTISLLGINTVISVSNSSPKKIPIYSVKRPDNKLSLTFNCAWGDEDIPEILSALKKYNAKATFFLVGTWAEKYPDSVKKIVEHGHQLGGHSYNHSHYQQMNYSDILADIERCDQAIEAASGCDVNLVRGGYGEYNNDVLTACKETGRTYIQWSKDSLDYKAQSTEDIISRTKEAKAGDIILMHTGTKFTSQALDSLLSELTESYELVTISELIYKDNFTIDHSGMQILNTGASN